MRPISVTSAPAGPARPRRSPPPRPGRSAICAAVSLPGASGPSWTATTSTLTSPSDVRSQRGRDLRGERGVAQHEPDVRAQALAAGLRVEALEQERGHVAAGDALLRGRLQALAQRRGRAASGSICSSSGLATTTAPGAPSSSRARRTAAASCGRVHPPGDRQAATSSGRRPGTCPCRSRARSRSASRAARASRGCRGSTSRPRTRRRSRRGRACRGPPTRRTCPARRGGRRRARRWRRRGCRRARRDATWRRRWSRRPRRGRAPARGRGRRTWRPRRRRRAPPARRRRGRSGPRRRGSRSSPARRRRSRTTCLDLPRDAQVVRPRQPVGDDRALERDDRPAARERLRTLVHEHGQHLSGRLRGTALNERRPAARRRAPRAGRGSRRRLVRSRGLVLGEDLVERAAGLGEDACLASSVWPAAATCMAAAPTWNIRPRRSMTPSSTPPVAAANGSPSSSRLSST